MFARKPVNIPLCAELVPDIAAKRQGCFLRQLAKFRGFQSLPGCSYYQLAAAEEWLAEQRTELKSLFVELPGSAWAGSYLT